VTQNPTITLALDSRRSPNRPGARIGDGRPVDNRSDVWALVNPSGLPPAAHRIARDLVGGSASWRATNASNATAARVSQQLSGGVKQLRSPMVRYRFSNDIAFTKW
jgi:hypothetical protein